MKNIDPQSPVLVTGGTGYLASWIIKYLLEAGKTVRTTVRNKANSGKYEHLINIAKESSGNLEILEADLMQQHAFIEAMQNCELVIHTASPFKVGKIKNPEMELVTPALEGTQNVLQAANQTKTVKRIVLTSSVAAVYGDAEEIKDVEIFDESHWNKTSNLNHNPYPYSKTVAEKKAWQMAEAQSHWDLITINPGFIMGPSLSQRKDSTSIDFMLQLADGKMKSGAPNLYFGLVDVRDVAMAHVNAGFNVAASGRHILVANSLNIYEIGQIIKKHAPQLPVPKGVLPNFLLYLSAPLIGFNWKFLQKNLGYQLKFDNSYSKNDLNIKYRSLDDTFADHIKQLQEDELLNMK